MEIFLATGLTYVGATPDGPEEESMSVRLVPFEDAVAMCMESAITDSKSVIGILRAARVLGR